MSNLNRMLKTYDNTMVTHCPLCLNSIHFKRDDKGQWIRGLSCCHLRSVAVEDGKYIGKFSYERGKFEGIKEENKHAVN